MRDEDREGGRNGTLMNCSLFFDFGFDWKEFVNLFMAIFFCSFDFGLVGK